MGAMDTAKGIGRKLRLDSHHAIERFGIMMLLLTVTFGMLVTAGIGFSVEKNRKQLGEQAIYTTNFTTSKTNIKGNVVGVFANKDKSRAMVMLKFDDVVKVAADAKDYQSFLTGSNLNMGQERPKGTPSGSIYVFGTTGYMGVYLVNAGGFESQILNLTMRAKAELVTPNSTSSKGDEIDGSFQKFDQWRVYFNPGASQATELKSLEGSNPNPREIFYETVIRPQEQTVRDTLDADLKKMQTSLADIEEKTNRLNTTTVGNTGTKVIAPGAMEPSQIPEVIAGDKVTGKEKVGNTASTLALESKHVLSGGYDFDWRSGNIQEGYLDKLAPAGMDYVSFLSKKGNEPSPKIDVSDSAIKWTLTDGQLLSAVDRSNMAYKPVVDNVQNLTLAYTTYFNDKTKYETKTLPELLNLEVVLRSVEANNSVNTDKNVMLVY